MNTPASTTEIIREVKFNDASEITKLLRGLGLAMPATPKSIEAHWRRLWIDNPAVIATGNSLPLGWVLEKEGNIVGLFCNLLRLYYLGGRQVIVAGASQWGLEKRHRAKIRQLADAYFEQEGVDVLMATTANVSAGRILERYGALRIPQPEYDQIYYWVLDGPGFIGAALNKKLNHPGLISWVQKLIGPFAGMGQFMVRKFFFSTSGEVSHIGVNEIGAEFDDLWNTKFAEADKFLACRSSDSLRWHFGSVGDAKEARVFVHRQERLRGYMVVMRDDVEDIKLKRLRIADLFVEDDDAAVVANLLCAAYDYGRQQGYHSLEWIGMSSKLRDVALRHRPLVRKLPTWPLYYKGLTAEIADALQGSEPWYITFYDGDTTLA